MGTGNGWAGLELRHLLALKAIVECGSFHKAAAYLDYTQSGVSQQIAALERIVGDQLIERPGGSRPVRLTEVGEIVLSHGRAVLDQVSAAQTDVAALRRGAGGALRVGAFQSVSATILPALLGRLKRDRSGIQVELTQTTSDPELFALLEAGRLDVTFAMLPVPEGPFGVAELFSDPFVVLAGPGSALARLGRSLSLLDLVNVPLVAPHGCRYTGYLEAQMRERGFEPTVAYRSDDNGTVLGLVAAGAGVALVPRLVAESASGEVVILELDEPLPPRRVALAWRSDRRVQRTRDDFIDAAEKTCSALSLRRPRRITRTGRAGPLAVTTQSSGNPGGGT
jgi:DNA-binding transcriptional LysR family regulator